MNDVYWRIYRAERLDWKLTIVCMQWFDEYDYHQDRFFTDENGSVLQFDTEKEAQIWLSKNVKSNMIDPEHLLVSSLHRENYLK